jgi:TolA-binding protein
MANRARNMPGSEPKTETIQEIQTLKNFEAIYEKNKKPINTVFTILFVAIVGYFAYDKLYKAPQEDKAANAVSFAQRYFEVDSVNRALNGDGQHNGFLQVMKKYSGTNVANLCHYYAGVCYIKMGDFNKAVKELKDFDAKGTMLQYTAWGLLGDAYMEMNKQKEALEYYEKAIGNKDDKNLTPTYLYRAALVCEMGNKAEDAKKMYLRIRDEYPKSPQSRDVIKNLARLGVTE